ncbi:MAG: 16S rRNA processing protein RimM [Nevskiaceae bacterium]|nr:MAG: 16S rRNA processing protein RimM [Nevskiaceae bacterium]
MSERRVTLGRVAGAYGVKGWLKVHSFTRPEGNLLDYRLWWIAKGQGYEAKLLEGRVHGRGLVAQISDRDGHAIEDRDLAESLVGAEIQVARDALPPLPEGQFYWCDLIGVRVESQQGDALGLVADVTSNGAQDVLVVKEADTERLIPFVQGPIIKSVDLGAGLIVADWLPEY